VITQLQLINIIICLSPPPYAIHAPPISFFSPGSRLSVWIFPNRICFYGEELFSPRPNPKLEDYSLSAVRSCLFNIYAATLHIAGRSSIRNLKTRHAVVTGTNLS
jgi:hypothetical protein